MSKHTPGPWTLKPHGVISGGKPIQLPNGMAVQQIAMATILDDGDRDANARLIAAAPELLEALQDVLRNHCAFSDTPSTDRARAAVAKATGEQS